MVRERAQTSPVAKISPRHIEKFTHSGVNLIGFGSGDSIFSSPITPEVSESPRPSGLTLLSQVISPNVSARSITNDSKIGSLVDAAAVDEQLPFLPLKEEDRKQGTKYRASDGSICTWNGKNLSCGHGKLRHCCKTCGKVRSSSIGDSEMDHPHLHEQADKATALADVDLAILPSRVSLREEDAWYRTAQGEVVIWKRKRLHCVHSREKRYCNVCKGTGNYCVHNKVHRLCLQCNPPSQVAKPLLCVAHGLVKAECKGCSAGPCEHGRRKYRCVKCGGSGICEHSRVRSRCKVCGESQVCSHGREKKKCEDCGGETLCVHEKVKSQCTDCGGSGMCAHGKSKYSCENCGESCVHKRLKYTCKDCGALETCQHGWVESICEICKDAVKCEHGNVPASCMDCPNMLVKTEVLDAESESAEKESVN